MTRGDSTASLLAACAVTGARTSTGITRAAVGTAIAAVTTRVNSILDPLGIQRHIRRHRRAKVIRLGVSLIGVPTGKGVTIARGIRRLGNGRAGSRRLIASRRATLSIKLDAMGLRLHAEQVAGIVGVIQVTKLVTHHRSHAIVGISRTGGKDFGRLGIAQPVHVHAAARSVVGPVTLGAVQSEVHVRLAIMHRDERRALRFEAELFAIGLCNLLHAHIGKVDDRKQTLSLPIVRSRTANKGIFAAKHRR